jgi:single-strand DNA-binding protein
MYQKILIVGNLGRDPELRYTPAGSPVCNFSVAVNRRRNDEDVVVWFRVVAWGSLAEACNTYLSKGRQVLVEGELLSDHATGGPKVYTRSDGTAGASFEVKAHVVKFLQGGREQEQKQEPEPEPWQEDLPF